VNGVVFGVVSLVSVVFVDGQSVLYEEVEFLGVA
jgi:hypothetical protein